MPSILEEMSEARELREALARARTAVSYAERVAQACGNAEAYREALRLYLALFEEQSVEDLEDIEQQAIDLAAVTQDPR